MKNEYGFECGRNVYGFEKKAWSDLDDAAYYHGFRGPSASDDPGTPVNMSLVSPSLGSRMANGIGGGIIGGLGGAVAGGMLGSVAGPVGTAIGAGVGGLSGSLGLGYHAYQNAPKELILRHPQTTQPTEPPKTAADVYGFTSKEALAAPGLLGQMGSALGRMGKATSIAGQRAGNAFQAGQGLGAVADAGKAGYNSLMKSRAGQRVLGTGAGLGAAGLLAGGSAMLSSNQPKPVVNLPH